MKISKRDQKLLLCTGGILIAVLAYLLVFRSFSEKNAVLEDEKVKLSNEVARLELLDVRKETYLETAEELSSLSAEMINQFPSEIREETAIMYAYDMENTSDIHVNSMTINPANLLYTMGQYNTAATDNTTTDTTVVQGVARYLYGVTLNLDYTVSYEGFKDIINFIQSDTDKRNVERISLSYDAQTGNLLGTMVVNLFSLQGNDKVYEEPYIPSMPIGNTNPFGTSGAAGGRDNQEAGEDEGDTDNEADNGNSETD